MKPPSVNSNKQRRTELKRRKAERMARAAARATADMREFRLLARPPAGTALVNVSLLKPNNSYGESEFVRRGFYIDLPFACRDCGKLQVWTSTQQKWWYEVARGEQNTTAIRCRDCRRKERFRAAAHRERSEAGRIAKAKRND